MNHERVSGDSFQQYQQAFSHYFEGLLLGEFHGSYYATHDLESFDKNLAHRMETAVRVTERAFQLPDYQKTLEDAVKLGLRCYAVSGVPLEVPQVKFVANLLGRNNEWLYKTLNPTREVLNQVTSRSAGGPFWAQWYANKVNALEAIESLGLGNLSIMFRLSIARSRHLKYGSA